MLLGGLMFAGEILSPDGEILSPDGEILSPDGEILFDVVGPRSGPPIRRSEYEVGIYSHALYSHVRLDNMHLPTLSWGHESIQTLPGDVHLDHPSQIAKANTRIVWTCPTTPLPRDGSPRDVTKRHVSAPHFAKPQT